MRAIVLVVLVALSSVAGAADAPDPEGRAAKEHYTRARRDFDLALWDRAIAEYQIAYNLKADPVLLYNIAQCHRLAGRLEVAVAFYRNYLERAPATPKRHEIEVGIAELERAIALRADEQARRDQRERAREQKEMDDRRRPPPPRGRGLLGVGLGLVVGGALVAAGGALGFGLAARGASDEVTREAQNHTPFDPALESAGRTYQTMTIVSAAVGVAVVATGIALCAVAARRPLQAHALTLGGPLFVAVRF